MKHAKYLFAALALLASCNQGEVLVDMPETQPEAPRRIGFETFVNKSTRANSNALNDFYPTFNVFGWKTVGGEVTTVFSNVPVEYFTADESGDVVYTAGNPSDEWNFTANNWYYENVRYWDKMASSYQFCAYAPAAAASTVSATNAGVITIGAAGAPITVDTKNLMSTPATALAFTGFDYDYMTATSNVQSSPVTLNFKHLLAKFNVRIKLDNTKVTTAQDVTVSKIEIHNLGDKAYYVSNAGAVDGWTLGTASSDYTLAASNGYSLNAATNYDNHYVIEQLIIPQEIAKATGKTSSLTEYTEACIYVEYTIGSETFKSYAPLANLFASTDTYTFGAGKQYTLNITVGPEPIYFEAEVTTWADEVEGNVNMD